MTKKSLLPSVWEVPSKIRDRLGERVGRQRVIFEDGHLLLVLHRPPAADQVEREPALFWRQANGTWMSDQSGSGAGGLEELLQKYDVAIDACEGDESRASSAQDYHSVLDRIAPLHRASAHLYQVMQQARELVKEDRLIINIRDRGYELERRADLLYAGTKSSLDYAMAVQAEQQAAAANRMAAAAHRLNLLVAFFFPVATVASVLGVNLTFPYRDDASLLPFWIFLTVGLVFGSVLAMVLYSTSRGRNP